LYSFISLPNFYLINFYTGLHDFWYDAYKQAIRKAGLDDVEKWKGYKLRHIIKCNCCIKYLWLQKVLQSAHDSVHKIEIIKKKHSLVSKHIGGAIIFINHAKCIVRAYSYML
jgi:hypothetical protein